VGEKGVGNQTPVCCGWGAGGVNTQRPESNSKNQMNRLVFHFVTENSVCKTWSAKLCQIIGKEANDKKQTNFCFHANVRLQFLKIWISFKNSKNLRIALLPRGRLAIVIRAVKAVRGCQGDVVF
jgi:hypothetical protein